jgi:hypothetical protein
MSPIKFNAKEDYQVHEALNYLKSFEVFKKLSAFNAPTPKASAAAGAH